MDKKIYIVGAGPGGATAALFLAKSGIPSVLIDKSQFPRDKICGDACSGKVAWVLRKLDEQTATTLINSHANLPSWGVKFYGSENNELTVPFKRDYSTVNDTAPGFIAKRIDFDNQLIELVRKNPLIDFIENCPIQYYRRNGELIEFGNDSNNTHFKAKVLLAADGAYSAAAKELMQVEIPNDKNALGLRAYYKGVKGLDSEGFIELHFLKELLPGYFWIFPLPNGEANVGLGIRTDVQKEKRLNLKELFMDVVQKHPILAERFKGAELQGKIRLHGLPLGGHRCISNNQLILLGDAAALIDPFTGEGIGNAMISGMIAAEVLAENYESNSFNANALKKYDKTVYRRLGSELKLSQTMQNLTKYPWLFNLVVNKARKNKELRDTLSCMFESVDMRKKLRNPLFYLRILFG
ncbi:MAG: geranylgeranyl reductase family protein [Chitinophagales bacterium]